MREHPHRPPAGDPGDESSLSRRAFLKLLGASAALAGLEGCTTRLPDEEILPYVTQPPELTPGVPRYYATAMVLDGYATGLLVESHEGRPTKVEGNPDHPASLGAAGVFEQASVLELYDPDRARHVRRGRERATWEAFAAAFAPERLRERVGARGERLRILLEPTSSPLLAELLARLGERYPDARVHFHAPLAADAPLAAMTGDVALVPQYDLAAADVILAVAADPLASGPFHLRHARQFASRRRPEAAGGMSRLYVVESDLSVTGAAADHRLAVRPSAVEPLLHALLATVAPGRAAPAPAPPADVPSPWLAAVARDLVAHAGRALVVVGAGESPRAHALAHALNEALGSVGRTVWHTPSPLLGAGDVRAGLPALVDALRAGAVDTLVCLGGNPAYAAPADADLARLLRAVPNGVYWGLHENETAAGCTWLLPAAHYLESWGDARAYDGTLSIVQPLVAPLYGGRTASQLLAALLGDASASAHDLLRASWDRRTGGGAGDGEARWREALRRGVVEGTSAAPVRASPRPELLAAPASPAAAGAGVEVVFLPDARVHDGAFANNAWLQELPDPVTTLTWDNAAHLSARTAQRLGVETGDVLTLRAGGGGREVQLPALVVPGHAEETVSLRVGYGRSGAETVARGVGTSVYPLRPAGAPYRLAGVAVARAPGAARHALALTQHHWSLEGRDVARTTTLAALQSATPAQPPRARRALTLYEPPAPGAGERPAQQWAMTIDLSACTGCGACVVACQAENNVPVVGRDDVLEGREMHWLRVDRYVAGPADPPAVVSQPMLCQHCEKAPCEYVCPVEATVHSPDGLNEMVYNRCVGTRFCSNNCPYKVRRFNWFDYNRRLAETEAMARNPDVTVRERGVMEKCTFCVQRIREAEIAAELDRRPLAGDEVRTACQQACPAQAIVFGSLTDARSEVARLREDRRAYAALGELGTEPRVRYLARVTNPNPELGDAR